MSNEKTFATERIFQRFTISFFVFLFGERSYTLEIDITFIFQMKLITVNPFSIYFSKYGRVLSVFVT